MLEDRSYMRSEGFKPRMPLSILLMIILTAIFGLQEISKIYFRAGTGFIDQYLALSNGGLAHGYVWQLLTFQFLHGGLMHLLSNLIGIWFFGRFIEDRLGRGNFLKIYLFSGIAGGLLQSLLGFIFPQFFGGHVIGASAGVFGLLAAFALHEPNTEILLFFVLPVRMKYFLMFVTGIALFFTLVPSDRTYAHAAHLGGIALGAAYIHFGLQARSPLISWRPFLARQRRRELVKAANVKPTRWPRSKLEETEDLPPTEFISREVDPILDKISAHGMQSLTPRERRILEAARAKMEKR